MVLEDKCGNQTTLLHIYANTLTSELRGMDISKYTIIMQTNFMLDHSEQVFENRLKLQQQWTSPSVSRHSRPPPLLS